MHPPKKCAFQHCCIYIFYYLCSKGFYLGKIFSFRNYPSLYCRFLIEHGNTTVYEWKYGEKPIEVEEPVLEFQEDDDEPNNDIDIAEDIDFGDDAEIDFGGEGDAIDFGDDTGEIDFGDSGAEIDFGDDQENFDLDGVDTSTIVVEEGGMAGGVARNDEALSLLDNRRTRTIIVDELEVSY